MGGVNIGIKFRLKDEYGRSHLNTTVKPTFSFTMWCRWHDLEVHIMTSYLVFSCGWPWHWSLLNDWCCLVFLCTHLVCCDNMMNTISHSHLDVYGVVTRFFNSCLATESEYMKNILRTHLWTRWLTPSLDVFFGCVVFTPSSTIRPYKVLTHVWGAFFGCANKRHAPDRF